MTEREGRSGARVFTMMAVAVISYSGADGWQLFVVRVGAELEG